MRNRESLLDRIVHLPAWRGLSPDRLIPLVESAELRTVEQGGTLFEQFHPAQRVYLLASGSATQSTLSASRTDMVHVGTVDWTDAVLGWSGFLAPRRYGSTAVADDAMTLLSWSHDELASLFYADPELAIRFFDLVLDSVRRQLFALRARRVDGVMAPLGPPQREPMESRRPVVGRADSCLRRSAFFAPFADTVVNRLAMDAELLSFEPGARVARQDDDLDGALLLASGRCNAYFEAVEDGDIRLVPFRRLHNRIGIVAGVPGGTGYLAEATVYADSHCWVYRVPAAAIEQIKDNDPETGRAIQQRLLARLAGLIGALQVERNPDEAEPEIALVANLVANSQARLPVTSDLHKVPHLLAHRLTVGNAFATLKKVAETGRYHERLLAGRCSDALSGLAAEDAFYRQILEACEAVVSADDSHDPKQIRDECDAAVADAFDELDCRVLDRDKLPEATGHIFILNHLACPEYYELPNAYHFSFDTAFVSAILWRHFKQSPIRVVRESPDIEFGHNLFYRRLGHITVPTIESDAATLSEAEFRARRREAAEQFFTRGRELLEAGENLVICPEGQSQPAELSPGRFHTGAFRLAIEAHTPIVPVALAGFHRRFKDGPLVGIVSDPLDVAATMKSTGQETVREFAETCRGEFAASVARAAEIAAGPPRL